MTRAMTDAPAFARWKAALPERLQREVDLIQDRLMMISPNATTRGAERLLVSAREWPNVPGCCVTMEEAIRAVVLPTYVLVENAIRDRAFFRRAMPPAWRERLEQWERLGLLRYEQAGGSTEMLNIIKCHADDAYARQAFGLPSKVWCRVHVVVYDHDGDTAERPGKDAQKLDAYNATGLRDRKHRLRRRDQEHYLPEEAMKAIVDEHFGNSSGDRDEHLARIYAHFRKGAERHFAKFSMDLFKNAFYEWEELDWQDEWFQNDGAWPEMTVIAEMIAAAI